MNDHISWLLMPGYVLRLVDMAAALHKPYHTSRSEVVQPLLEYGWLTCRRKTDHNAWYELTDEGQQLVYRLLCNYFERSIPYDEFEIALQDYLLVPHDKRLNWINNYRQRWDTLTSKVLSWLDEQGIYHRDAEVTETFMAWASHEAIPEWQWVELLIMARDKGNQREMTARHETMMREKSEAYLQQIAEGNLIEEAAYMQKYGFSWDQMATVRQIIEARNLHNPILKRMYWHYKDEPFTEEQQAEWLKRGRYTAYQAAEKLGISVEQFRKLAKKQGIKPIAVEARANNIWGVAYYRAGEIENLRSYRSKLPENSKRKGSTKHLTLWESLSAEQQKLLLAVYYEDQINEANAKARARSNFHAPKAAEWRWTPFVRSQLQKRFRRARLQPSKEDFQALQDLGLLEVGTVWLFPNRDAPKRMPYEAVQMTRLGRAVVRANPKHQEEVEDD
jgi:hypothetical protein